MAAVLACGPGALLSHLSGAAHWGILPNRSLIEVSRRRSGGHRLSGIRIHRPRHIDETEYASFERIPVTTVARTLVDIAPVVTTRKLEQALAAAERASLVNWQELEAAVDRARWRRGYARLRDVMSRADPRVVHTASEAERLLLEICGSDPDIPPPSNNVVVGGRVVDFVWIEQRLIAETDGRTFHSDAFSFEDDRERDGGMLEDGYRTVRFTYRMLSTQPEKVAGRLRKLLANSPVQFRGERHRGE